MQSKWAKLIRSLQQKKFRQETGFFLVEGEKSVCELLQAEKPVEAVFYTEKAEKTILPLLRKSIYKNIFSEKVSQTDLEKNGTLQSNDSLIAVARIPAQMPFSLEEGEYALALADVRDPGNLGTIMRIADWYGIRKIICSETTVDAYNPKVIAASMGSFCRTQLFYNELGLLFSKLKCPIYGAFLDGQIIYETQFSSKGGIIVMGNESQGIPPELEKWVSQKIFIPRFGGAESLNVGVATAIVCDNWRRSMATKVSSASAENI
jgi:RNA methyltransferase, TrmH family